MNYLEKLNIARKATRVMHKLKIRLLDDEIYTFSTLSFKEAEIFQDITKKQYREYPNIDNIVNIVNGLEYENDKDGNSKQVTATEEQRELCDKFEKASVASAFDTLLSSISKCHEKFRISPTRSKEAIIDELKELIDLRDMPKLAQFAMSGIYKSDDDEDIAYNEVIDLTK